MLYNTTNGHHQPASSQQFYNNNLPHRNARAQHLDMSRCWDVANFCPLVTTLLYTTSCRIVVSSSVGGVRSRCPCSGVWALARMSSRVRVESNGGSTSSSMEQLWDCEVMSTPAFLFSLFSCRSAMRWRSEWDTPVAHEHHHTKHLIIV